MSTPARRRFGLRVRLRRENLGLSLRKAAAKAGLHYTYLASVERGERNLGLDNLFKVARALRMDPADLVRGLHRG